MDLSNLKPLGFSNEPEYIKKEKEDRSRKRKLNETNFPAKPKKVRRPRRVGNSSWCLCRKCIPMDTERRSVCCMNMSSGTPENRFGHAK